MTEAVMEPIFHPIEMGLEWLVLQEKLESLPYYAPLFNNAYLRPDITYTGVQQALAAFVSVMQSKQSKIDQHALNLEEKKGAGLFATKYECAACHQGSVDVQGTFNYPSDPVFRITEFANIGLQETYEDNGLSLITQAETDEGRFRVPSLSNVALTAPYMHDGSITSLEDVIEHYSGGIMSHHNLDARLLEADRTPLQMTISADEKKALVAFLKAFTDEDVATNPRLTDPFKSSEN
jgi:cytochrome c peroxidase